jgi:hypothetical protein
MLKFFTAPLLLLALHGAAHAQCAGGVCLVPAQTQVVYSEPPTVLAAPTPQAVFAPDYSAVYLAPLPAVEIRTHVHVHAEPVYRVKVKSFRFGMRRVYGFRGGCH